MLLPYNIRINRNTTVAHSLDTGLHTPAATHRKTRWPATDRLITRGDLYYLPDMPKEANWPTWEIVGSAFSEAGEIA
jgi:hypothetical protein